MRIKSILFFLAILLPLTSSVFAQDNESIDTSAAMRILFNDKAVDSKFKSAKAGDVIEGTLFVNTVDLKVITPRNAFSKGEVLPAETKRVYFNKSGTLSYIVGRGDYIFRSLFNSDGSIEENGTVFATIDEVQVKAKVEASKKRKEIAEKSYQYMHKMTQANQTLAEKQVITPFELEQSEISLLSDLLQYETNSREMDEIVSRYKDGNLYSPVSGIVKNVYAFPGENVNIGSRALNVMVMDPVTIKIKCWNAFLNIYNKEVEAYVYSANSPIPIKAPLDVKEADKTYAYVILKNEPIIASLLSTGQQKLPKVFALYPVKDLLNLKIERFYLPEKENSKEVLAVPVESIRADEKGFYVFKAIDKNIKGLRTALPLEVRIKKTYIEPLDAFANIYFSVDISTKVQAFKPNPDLNANDIVIGASEPGLKDGEVVIRCPLKWNFYPGQIVKVEIPELTPKAIYLPKTCVINSGTNENQIYIVENDILRLKAVDVIGTFADYVAIQGAGISTGKRAVMIDQPDLFNFLYDGRKVKILNSSEAPLFLEKPYALNFAEEPLEAQDKSEDYYDVREKRDY